MWKRFANPFFPLMNDVFQSPFGANASLRDTRWAARGLLGLLLPPVDAALGFHQRLQENGLRDSRLLWVSWHFWRGSPRLFAVCRPDRPRLGPFVPWPSIGWGQVRFWVSPCTTTGTSRSWSSWRRS